MEKQIIATKNAPAAVGPYVQAIVANGMLYMSGQIGLHPETGAMADTLEAQTHQVFANIKAVLAEAGLDFSDVVKTTVFLLDMADFGKVNEIYGSYFTESLPARSCVAVQGLPKNAQIEIEALAVLK